MPRLGRGKTRTSRKARSTLAYLAAAHLHACHLSHCERPVGGGVQLQGWRPGCRSASRLSGEAQVGAAPLQRLKPPPSPSPSPSPPLLQHPPWSKMCRNQAATW